ncbi:M48 family metalloprotease [Chachezhania antarctica]|uniref:M48 family metalloprotease n=1 Tax=Chachezhania antarctica TaxID=2340860 RepID=UPI000EB2ED2A|nr:M48 family metalloprotease [Chachezhania antarctica]|tara:strand:- start:1188 stop:1898 length:711 start_codon:yes stop_codon:yes gene_type:complete
MFRVLLLLACFVAACDVAVQPAERPTPAEDAALRARADAAAEMFTQVVTRVEPAAEKKCRQVSQSMPCDFLFRVDVTPGAPVNAYQSEDLTGRPVITISGSMILDVRNADELAFVLSHEASHHILNHIRRQRESAAYGAELLAQKVAEQGGSARDIRIAQELGAAIGSRVYSKNHELEADELGTIITANAGYNPLIGMGYFEKTPDPGDKFLGTHPPNSDRRRAVQQTSSRIGVSL